MIIKIGHKAQNGKDSLAESILKNKDRLLFKEIKIIKFADSLKEEIQEVDFVIDKKNHNVFSIRDNMDNFIFNSTEQTSEDVCNIILSLKTIGYPKIFETEGSFVFQYDEYLRTQYPTIVGLLQWYGTEFRRALNPNYWVEKYCNKIINLNMSNNDLLVLTPDCRMLNEYYAKVSGHTSNYIEVIRIDKSLIQFIDVNRSSTHISEVALDEIANHPTTLKIINYDEPNEDLRLDNLFESFQAIQPQLK